MIDFTFQPPEKFLLGKTILVTGASDGIGRACACSLAEQGANLVLLGRNIGKLESLFDDLEQRHPGRAVIQPLDYKQAAEESYKELADSFMAQFDSLDGMIHCAGELGARAPIQFYPSAVWRDVFEVNVHAAFELTKAFMPALQASNDARLIFLSSSVGRLGRAHWGAYSASKFALEGMVQILADELGNTSQVTVTSLNPGGTRTAMRRAAYPAENPDAVPAAEELMPVFLYLFSEAGKAFHGKAVDARGFNPTA